MQEYRPGSGNRRRRRRGRHHPYGEAPKKKTGLAALVAGIAGLFSKKKKPAPQESAPRFEQRGRGRDRDRDFDRRRRGRQEHGEGAGREHRALREAAEAPHGETVFKETAGADQHEHADQHEFAAQHEHHEHATQSEQSRPQAPEVMTEVTTPRLYVGNLSYDASESDLFDLFSQAGGVRNVEIATDKRTHRSKGFGFVEMESVTVAEAAQKKFHAYHLMGREMVVTGAKSQRSDDRGDRGGDRGDRRGGGRDRGDRRDRRR